MRKKLFITFLIFAGLVMSLVAMRTYHYHRHQANAANLPTPLFFFNWGTQGSPLVLLHGAVASGRYFETIVPQLTANHRVIAPDILGFGRSPWPEKGYAVADHVKALKQTLDFAMPKEKFTVIGHSMGGFLALNLAQEYPDQVESVIILAPSLVTSFEEIQEKIAKTSRIEALLSVNPFFAFPACYLHQAINSGFLPITRFFLKGFPEAIVEDMLLHTWKSFRQTYKQVVLDQNFDEMVSRVKKPTLIILGDRDAYTNADRLGAVKGLSHVQVHMIPGDHNLILNNPTETLKHIKSFLDTQRRQHGTSLSFF